MIIPNPPGYTFYIGADGFDALIDADGWIWFADNFKSTTQKGYFKAHVYRTKNGVTERINLPEDITGAIRLNWTPYGVTVSGSYQAHEGAPIEPRVFQLTEFAQVRDGVPVVQTITIEKTIDQGARDLYNATVAISNIASSKADSAKATAETAYNVAKSAQNSAGTAQALANDAIIVANSKPSIDTIWGKINDRLFILAHAIKNNDRSDALNALWMDVLFAKVNDWIYGKLKDYKLIP